MDIDGQFDAGRININWVSNTAYKTDYFTLQRIDNTTGEFQDLKTLNSITESDDLNFYNESDDNPQEGENVYRVKATFLDGTIGYTTTKTIKSVQLNKVRLYPNPASDNLDVNLTGYEGKPVELTIYNTFGITVGNYKIESAGKERVNLDVSQYNSGTYILRIASQGKKDLVQKFLVE